jgi:hypothetical protein
MLPHLLPNASICVIGRLYSRPKNSVEFRRRVPLHRFADVTVKIEGFVIVEGPSRSCATLGCTLLTIAWRGCVAYVAADMGDTQPGRGSPGASQRLALFPL